MCLGLNDIKKKNKKIHGAKGKRDKINKHWYTYSQQEAHRYSHILLQSELNEHFVV